MHGLLTEFNWVLWHKILLLSQLIHIKVWEMRNTIFFKKINPVITIVSFLCERNVGACLNSQQITAHQQAYGSNLSSFLYSCQVALAVLDVAVEKFFQACSFSTYGCCLTGSQTHISEEICVNVDNRDILCVY